MQVPIWSAVTHGFENERIAVPLALDPLDYLKAPAPKLNASVTLVDTSNQHAFRWDMSGVMVTQIDPYILKEADCGHLVETYFAIGKMFGFNE